MPRRRPVGWFAPSSPAARLQRRTRLRAPDPADDASTRDAYDRTRRTRVTGDTDAGYVLHDDGPADAPATFAEAVWDRLT